MKIIVARITPALLDHDQALVSQAASVFSTLHQRLGSEAVTESLILSVKFAAARAVLLERLQRSLAQPIQADAEVAMEVDQTEADPQVEEPTMAPSEITPPATPEKTCEHGMSNDNMQIEHPDDPEPLFITLDQELGVQLRVRPPCRRETTTPPVDSLVRSFSSVLVSPFVDGHKSDEDHDGDAVEMRTIDQQVEEEVVKADRVLEEQNPFLAT